MPRVEVPTGWNPRVESSGDALTTTFAMGPYGGDQFCMALTDNATNQGMYVGGLTRDDLEDLIGLIRYHLNREEVMK